MGWNVPWYSMQDSAEALLDGRRVNRFCLVWYLRHRDGVFETYWTNGRGVEAMDNSYGLLDMTSTDGKRRGRTRPPVGRDAASTIFGLTVASSPNGPGCRQDAPTTLAPSGVRVWSEEMSEGRRGGRSTSGL
jgi:hypothetical protein